MVDWRQLFTGGLVATIVGGNAELVGLVALVDYVYCKHL
jgi:hypothetical protein